MPSPSPARRVTRNGGARNAGQYAPSGSAGNTRTRGGGGRQPPPARRRATPSPRRGAPNQSARARSTVPDPGDDDDAVHGVGLVKLINLCGKLGIDDDQVDGTRDSASGLFALVIAALPREARRAISSDNSFQLVGEAVRLGLPQTEAASLLAANTAKKELQNIVLLLNELAPAAKKRKGPASDSGAGSASGGGGPAGNDRRSYLKKQKLTSILDTASKAGVTVDEIDGIMASGDASMQSRKLVDMILDREEKGESSEEETSVSSQLNIDAKTISALPFSALLTVAKSVKITGARIEKYIAMSSDARNKGMAKAIIGSLDKMSLSAARTAVDGTALSPAEISADSPSPPPIDPDSVADDVIQMAKEKAEAASIEIDADVRAKHIASAKTISFLWQHGSSSLSAALPAAAANPKPFDQAAFRLALREGRRADWLQLLADNRKLVDTVVSAVRAKSVPALGAQRPRRREKSPPSTPLFVVHK